MLMRSFSKSFFYLATLIGRTYLVRCSGVVREFLCHVPYRYFLTKAYTGTPVPNNSQFAFMLFMQSYNPYMDKYTYTLLNQIYEDVTSDATKESTVKLKLKNHSI